MPEHSELSDDQLHEAKGAAAASAGEVLKGNGDGTATFQTLSYTELADIPTPVGYDLKLYSTSSASTQEPATTDTALQIEFGDATAITELDLSADGTLTALEEGYFLFNFFLRFGRSGSSGTSVIFNRFLVNDVATASSNSTSISSSDEIIPFSAAIPLYMGVGDSLKLEIYRDSAGTNSGGLLSTTATLSGWNDSSSASVFVYKYVGSE